VGNKVEAKILEGRRTGTLKEHFLGLQDSGDSSEM
jgi:hypothetical protein